MAIPTQAITASRTGTGWSLDVTNANLDSDILLKDFIVLFDGVVQSNLSFNKVTASSITYSGASLVTSTVVEVRRRTPVTPKRIIQYGNKFYSSDWNDEMERVSRRAAEYELFGIGSLGGVSAIPQNAPFGITWSGDTINSATRNALYDKLASIDTGYAAADTALQNQINTKAPLASPALTGTPTAPTPSLNDNTTKLATMQALQAQLDAVPTPTFGGNTQKAINEAYLQNNLRLLVPFGVLSQAIPNSTVTQLINLPAATVNRGSIYNATAGTFTPGVTGIYLLSGLVKFAASSANIDCYIQLYTGATFVSDLANVPSRSGYFPAMAWNALFTLTAGTAYHIRAFAGGAATTTSNFSLALQFVSP